MTAVPLIEWAQRADTVLMTVNVTDAQDVKIEITESFKFTATDKSGKAYEVTIPLFAEVVAEESSNAIKPRAVEVKLQKKNVDDEYWPRLTKEKLKSNQIKIDWNRWKDEDEEAAAPEDFGQGGMPGMMGGAGGPGGMGGMGGMPGGMEGMMGGMGGMGGAGGMGGMDMAEMLKNMGGMGGMGGPEGAEGGGDSDDEEEMPPLEKE
eukprot:202946_1